MANKLRSVNTKFWDDGFIIDLKPTEKLLFLYLLTNPLTNILGIYEINVRRISFDTGINQENILNAFESFKKVKKAFYEYGFIILPNFLKNQNLNANMKKGVISVFNELPNELKNKILGNDLESVSNDYQTILNSLLNYEVEIEVEDKIEDENKISKIKVFYYNEIEKNKDNEHINLYKDYVSFLFGNNDIKQPLTSLLNMNNQILYETFIKYLSKCKEDGKSIITQTYKLYNSKTLDRKKSFSLSLSDYLKY